ncbi:uncharacterized protein LOC135486968 [Lineus longissimus]|uniref:uncharacterized protein LOC135486968 n=1 Tax=Lineus longissimus TaxID=88925 RepID=UPI002B4DE902
MKFIPMSFHESCLPLIGLLIVSFSDTKVNSDCVVPKGKPSVICLGTDEDTLTSWDLRAHVGDTIFGKCIVSKDCNVENVYVAVDPKSCSGQQRSRSIREPNGNVKKVDEHSVTFTLPNVSKDDEGFYQCRCSHLERPLDNIYLYTGRTPLKPYVSPENLMIANWQSVSMKLSPSYHQQMSHIGKCQIFNLTWTIKYSLSRRNTPFLHCGSKHSMSCSFTLNDFQPNMTLYLEVTLKTVMDTIVTNLDIDSLDDRVKPARPSNLHISNESSTSLDISWDSPNRHFAILYMISLTASNVKHKLLRNVTNITQVKISGLIPHGLYNISLSAKPPSYGLVSNEVYTLHEMKADVPGRDPVLIPGGFDATVCGGNCKNVTIYWKPIPEQFCNGAINYIVVLNGHHQTVDDNRSHHIVTNLARDSPSTVHLFATNKDEKIGRNHSLPGKMIDIPADGKVPLVLSVTYKEMNETHRLMTWVLNDDDVSVSVVQCREMEEGGCEEKAPPSSTLIEPGKTSAVTSAGFRTGIGITEDGKEMGIFWSEEAAPGRANMSKMNETHLIIIGSVASVILIALAVWGTIYWKRSKRPIKMKPPKNTSSIGWVHSNDSEEFIGTEKAVARTLEQIDCLATPPYDPVVINDDDICSNSTDSDELNDSYNHGACGNCPFLGASDHVGRDVLERQPGDKEEVFVANRGNVATSPSLEMEDDDYSKAAFPADTCKCVRLAGEGPGRCEGTGYEEIELENMRGAKRVGKGDRDPYSSETCNMNNACINSLYGNQAIPRGLSGPPIISKTATVKTSKYTPTPNYAKVSFATEEMTTQKKQTKDKFILRGE